MRFGGGGGGRAIFIFIFFEILDLVKLVAWKLSLVRRLSRLIALSNNDPLILVQEPAATSVRRLLGGEEGRGCFNSIMRFIETHSRAF